MRKFVHPGPVVFQTILLAASIAATHAAAAEGNGSGPAEDLRVENTGDYPFRAVGMIQMLDADGNVSYCTGTLIGPRTVLTAAHCLFDREQRRWYEDFVFAPAVNGYGDLPFGTFDWQTAHILEGFTYDWEGYNQSALPFDVGLIILSEPIGETVGWLGFGYDNTVAMPYPVTQVAYPADVEPQASMWRAECRVTGDGMIAGLVAHDCPRAPGSDGAPLFVLDERDGALSIRAIALPGYGEEGMALPITHSLFEWVMQLRN